MAALWIAAVLAAAVNLLIVMRRTQNLHMESNTREEQAAHAAASWLFQTPTNARLLLFRSHRDVGAVWFNYRLNYFIYPRRHDAAWETLPPDAARRYEFVLAAGAAQQAMSPGWTAVRRAPFATLYTSNTHPQEVTVPVRSASGALHGPLGLLAGLFSLIVLLLLGALLLDLTGSGPLFDAWWANIATAHLVGAAAMSWLVTGAAVLTGRLLIWPVYLLLVLLAPSGRRVRARFFVSSTLPARQTSSKIGDAERKAQGDDRAPAPEMRRRTLARLCPLLFALIALSAGCLMERAWLMGIGWDGYSIWQFKAQAFIRDGNLSVLRDLSYADYAHMDYPLLVPLQTWWTGAHLGAYSERWAQGNGLLFMLDLSALFLAFARRYMLPAASLLGLALLVSLPSLLAHAVSGFADIEMACYLLALSIFLARLIVEHERNMRFPLLWMFAGIVQVKNEGLLAVAAGLLMLLYSVRRSRASPVALCAATAGIAYLPWFIRKQTWNLKSDLLQFGSRPHLKVSLLLWRFGYALRGFVIDLAHDFIVVFRMSLARIPGLGGYAVQLTDAGARGGGWGLLVLLLPAGLLQTIRRRVAICGPLWILCGLQTLGYLVIYMSTPYSLPWHLASSVDRLVLHLIPTLLLAALLGCFAKRPEPAVDP